MSFFKNFLSNKNQRYPTESQGTIVSRETLETIPRTRSNSSCNLDGLTSSRKNPNSEKLKYLNLVNQELNSENEKLLSQIEDLRVTIATNKHLLEDFCNTNSKLERQVKIYAAQIHHLTEKLRENNINYDEELNLRCDSKEIMRSNSPSAEAPSSTLTTERITKIANDRSNSICEDTQGKREVKQKRVNRKLQEASSDSSHSNKIIRSYRTAQAKDQKCYSSSITPQKPSLDIEKIGIFEENKLNETEEPISFRDNIICDPEDNLNLDYNSDFDYQNLEGRFHNRALEMKSYSPIGKIHLKRLSKECNTEEIMKLFDQVDNQILYDCDLQTNKLVYIQDAQDRIWEIKRSHVISPRPLTCLSSLKTVESPLSVEKEEFGFDPNMKNKTFIHDFSKLRIEISQEEGNDGKALIIYHYRSERH
ncbi:unnamed protein product [Moneuplotes crassus]|uniref:Uncharacterized protein n=1 Tax=Euplotes crassus TaxID=5936 RepID=A0AAD1UHP2_EUPCR|nr:unnamed protein product [Moneuplotes crassus]